MQSTERLYFLSRMQWHTRDEQERAHQSVCHMLQQVIASNADIGKSLRASAIAAAATPKIRPSTTSGHSSPSAAGKVVKPAGSPRESSVTAGRTVSISDLEFRKRKRRLSKAEPAICRSCNATCTPEWRKGPDGPRTLCNGEWLLGLCFFLKLTSSLNLSFLSFPFLSYCFSYCSLWVALCEVGQEA